MAVVGLFGTLVNILTIESIALVSIVAFTGVVSECVITSAILGTGIDLESTLIDVIALAWETGAIETCVTSTIETTWEVATVGVDVTIKGGTLHLIGTLVDVFTSESVAFVARVTLTSVVTKSIVTGCVFGTGINLESALIDVITLTGEASSVEAGITCAVEATWEVATVGIDITVKSLTFHLIGTLVDIFTSKSVTLVATWAGAVIESESICAHSNWITVVVAVEGVVDTGNGCNGGVGTLVRISTLEAIAVESIVTSTVIVTKSVDTCGFGRALV